MKLYPNKSKQAQEFIKDVISAITEGVEVSDKTKNYVILRRSSYEVTIKTNLFK